MNIFSRYKAYLKDNPNQYWFKRKLYGWGWTPARLPGWIATAVYLIAVVGVGIMLEQSQVTEAQGIAAFILATTVFIVIAWRTGEPPRWQWGVQSPTGNKK